MMNQEEFASLFQVGEIIDSGGGRAKLRIDAIEESFVRYQSLANQQKNRFNYSYIDVVVNGFGQIDPRSIQPSIQAVFLAAGEKKNYSTENYAYGFAREIIRRRTLSATQPLLYFGEQDVPPDEQPASPKPYSEGATRQVLVDRRERDPQAVAACKKAQGVVCLACGFDFAERYGKIGVGFIHVHHLLPMSMRPGQYTVNPHLDLIPLCPNCHAMVHRQTPPLTLSALRAILHANS